MPEEEYKRFKASILRNYKSKKQLSTHAVGNAFASLLLPPARIPFEVWVKLTDWQMLFLYLVPMMEHYLKELEVLAESEKG